ALRVQAMEILKHLPVRVGYPPETDLPWTIRILVEVSEIRSVIADPERPGQRRDDSVDTGGRQPDDRSPCTTGISMYAAVEVLLVLVERDRRIHTEVVGPIRAEPEFMVVQQPDRVRVIDLRE